MKKEKSLKKEKEKSFLKRKTISRQIFKTQQKVLKIHVPTPVRGEGKPHFKKEMINPRFI